MVFLSPTLSLIFIVSATVCCTMKYSAVASYSVREGALARWKLWLGVSSNLRLLGLCFGGGSLTVCIDVLGRGGRLTVCIDDWEGEAG